MIHGYGIEFFLSFGCNVHDDGVDLWLILSFNLCAYAASWGGVFHHSQVGRSLSQGDKLQTPHVPFVWSLWRNW